jgi:hypothetical protein
MNNQRALCVQECQYVCQLTGMHVLQGRGLPQIPVAHRPLQQQEQLFGCRSEPVSRPQRLVVQPATCHSKVVVQEQVVTLQKLWAGSYRHTISTCRWITFTPTLLMLCQPHTKIAAAAIPPTANTKASARTMGPTAFRL